MRGSGPGNGHGSLNRAISAHKRLLWLGDAGPVLLLFAVVKLGVHLATDGNIGYHQDELYYLASARHLQLGYVDYPPLTPAVAWVAMMLFDHSVIGLRAFAAISGAVVVILAGLTAAEMGGARRAQIIAGLAALCAPMLLGANWLFQTVTFDQLFWMAALYVLARLLRTGNLRQWLWLGLFLGLALETKYTVLALCLGIAVAVLVDSRLRSMLRTPYPWLGALIAILMWAPNLGWQLANGWPTLAYVRAHANDISSSGGVIAFLLNEILLVGPLVLPFWLLGWLHLFRDGSLRPLGIAAAIAFLALLPNGKAYYPGPIFPLVLAAAAVAVDRFAARRGRRWSVRALIGLLIADAIIPLPIGIPLLPESVIATAHLYSARKDFSDSIGWPEVTAQIANAWHALAPEQRAHAAILGRYYAEAGAVDEFGTEYGLPTALSPHLTYWYWKPARTDATTVVAIGYTLQEMQRYFQTTRQVGTLSNSEGVHNEAWGRAVIVCTNPIESLDAAWPSLRDFS